MDGHRVESGGGQGGQFSDFADFPGVPCPEFMLPEPQHLRTDGRMRLSHVGCRRGAGWLGWVSDIPAGIRQSAKRHRFQPRECTFVVWVTSCVVREGSPVPIAPAWGQLVPLVPFCALRGEWKMDSCLRRYDRRGIRVHPVYPSRIRFLGVLWVSVVRRLVVRVALCGVRVGLLLVSSPAYSLRSPACRKIAGIVGILVDGGR